ncbi:MAG: hypothetical protein QNJ98_11710 [Planctomycetota bacterium]|nr:hypothetical protein [Planctomycetota bacterium]
MDPLHLLLLQLFAAAAMTGLIWMVQLVQYPGFAHVPERGFRQVHQHHTAKITLVVFPLMVTELLVAMYLLAEPPAGTPAGFPWIGAALVGVVWLSTAFVQVPLHGKLAERRDLAAAARLVKTNWIRTAAWSLRSVLAAVWIAHVAA